MDNKNNITRIQFTITMVLCLFFSVTGSTFAYFAFSASNNTINGEAATVNLTLNVDKIFPTANSTNTGVMVPQLSVSGNSSSPLASALKSGCVDGNGNVVCQVYKIYVINDGGSATEVVDGIVSFYGDQGLTTDISSDMPNLKWKLINSVDVNTPGDSVLGSNVDMNANFNENVFVNDIILSTNDEFNYYMIIWINETTSDQVSDEGKTFYGKIEFKSSNGTGVTSLFTP